MLKKFFKSFTLAEWLIWSISVITIIVFFAVFSTDKYHYLIGSLIGVTALIFVSKGNPVGQILVIVFSVFYGVISYSFRYYGEMITYLGMSAPMAVVAFISWFKNPYKKGQAEVKINTLHKTEWLIFALLTAAVTVAFWFILKALNTNNLIVSTLSVTTSFSAAYLTARRSRFYALFYGANDVVLIVMWCLACAEDISYLPVVMCFAAFIALDGYGFINWSRMNRRQNSGEANV